MKTDENYNAFISELKTNKNVKVIMDDDTQLELTALSERFFRKKQSSLMEQEGITITDDDFDYFKLTGVYVSWESVLSGADFVLSGGVTFNGIVDALTMNSNFWRGAFSIAPDIPTPDNLKHFEQLGWFDRQAWDDGRRGCFIKGSKTFPPTMAFYSRGWFTEMNLTLDEYLTKMFDMYSVRGWQFFYIDVPKDIPYLDDVLHDMRLAAEQLPLLFPEKDWSYQINKYKETLSKLGK